MRLNEPPSVQLAADVVVRRHESLECLARPCAAESIPASVIVSTASLMNAISIQARAQGRPAELCKAGADS